MMLDVFQAHQVPAGKAGRLEGSHDAHDRALAQAQTSASTSGILAAAPELLPASACGPFSFKEAP